MGASERSTQNWKAACRSRTQKAKEARLRKPHTQSEAMIFTPSERHAVLTENNDSDHDSGVALVEGALWRGMAQAMSG